MDSLLAWTMLEAEGFSRVSVLSCLLNKKMTRAMLNKDRGWRGISPCTDPSLGG